uniref:Uncharacterized protein n=1 Tax=Rhizophora mucronata TaxID=61149 RepID=A0A2P2MYY6_RHIMU
MNNCLARHLFKANGKCALSTDGTTRFSAKFFLGGPERGFYLSMKSGLQKPQVSNLMATRLFLVVGTTRF